MSNSSSFGYSRSLEGKPKLFGGKVEIHLALLSIFVPVITARLVHTTTPSVQEHMSGTSSHLSPSCLACPSLSTHLRDTSPPQNFLVHPFTPVDRHRHLLQSFCQLSPGCLSIPLSSDPQLPPSSPAGTQDTQVMRIAYNNMLSILISYLDL